MIKSTTWIVLLFIILLHEAESEVVNLKTDFSQNIINGQDSKFTYIDSYFNNCLSKIDYCSNGLFGSFNLTILYPTMNGKRDAGYNYGRLVLFSSGGESPYSRGGIYLHQISVRGEEYLQFGLTYHDNLYSKNIYLKDKSSTRIGYIWNKNELEIYVDGSEYENIQSPVKRAYLDLNFNPVKTYRFFNEKNKQTILNQIWFTENFDDSSKKYIFGEESDYLIGCYMLNIQPDANSLLYDPDMAYFLQCKELCKITKSQYSVLNFDQCTCFENDQILEQSTRKSDCSEENSWKIYRTTSIRNDMPTKNLKLEVKIVIIRDPIEMGDPVGLDIKSSSDQNYILSVNFGDNTVKSIIGDGFVFHEYLDVGLKKANISAFSLTKGKRSFNRLIEFSVNLIKDREPMHSVNLKVDTLSERDVKVSIVSAGGLPYTCQLDMGDLSETVMLEPVNRVHTFIKDHSYSHTGIYNISVNCKNLNGIGNEVASSVLIYLPDLTKTNPYTVFDNTYVAKTYSQIIMPRPKDTKMDIDLALPFATSSPGLEFRVIDPLNKETDIKFISKPSAEQNHLTIKIKAENLKNFNENYLQVLLKDLVLASYLIVLEDSEDLNVSIDVATKVLVENKPVDFEITVPRTTNCLLRVDFGDDQVKFFTMHSFEKPDKKSFTLKLDHIYTMGMNFYRFKVSLANHLKKIELSKDLHFETSLPRFILNGVVHVPDVNIPIDFKLFTDPQIEPVKVDMINITFGANHLLNFKAYNFSKSNSFSLSFRHKFDQHGYFDVTANTSNQISYQISVYRVKVGLDLNTATAIVLNNFANIYEPIYFKLNVNGGNGYKVIVDYNDGQKMLLPWKYVSSSGHEIESVPGYMQSNAAFNQSGIYFSHQYSLPGIYEPTVDIISPFGQINIKFCTKVKIVPEPIIQTNETMDPSCFVQRENIDFYLNNVTVGDETFMKIARGMPNIFHTGFVSCVEPELNNLATRWMLMRIPMGKSLEHEVEASKYCSIQRSDSQLSIEAGELEFGNYSLRVYSYRPQEPENYVRHGVYLLKVDTSPLKVSLNNGIKSVELNLEESFLLSFYDKTYDPDSKVFADKTDFEFYFVCVQDYYSKRDLVKKIQNSMFALDLDLAAHDLNLAFYSDDLKTWFYEKDCFKVRPEMTMAQNPISVRNRDLLISGDTLLLNQSLAMNVQLYAVKKGRVSVSQQVIVTMNMSKLFSISLDSDFDQINDQLNKLDDLAKQNPQKALNILTGFASVVNNKAADPVHNQSKSTNKTDVDAGKEFSNIRNRMLGTVGNIVDRVDDGDSILTAAQTVGSVSSNSDQMPIENQDSGSFAIEKMGDKAKNLGDQGPEMANEIASSILGATGNTFDAAIKTVPMAQENFTDPGLLEPEEEKPPVILPAKITAPLEFYECDDCDDFPDEVYEEILVQEEIQFEKEEETRKHTAEIAKRTFNGVSGAGLALASSSSNGSNMTRIQQKNMALIVGKKNLNDTDNESETEFSTEGGLSIVMPVISNVVNTSNSSMPSSIVTSMIASNENPLQSSKSKASGMIVSLKLTDDFGNPIVVNNTAEPFNIKVPASVPAPFFKAYVNQTGINYHKLFLATKSSSLHFVIKPEIPGDIYHIYIKYSKTKVTTVYPDEKHHDYAFTSPNLLYTDPSNELMYSAFISNNETKGNGTYYIGVKLAVASNLSRIWLNETNSTHYISYYNIRIFSTACKYWKEDTNEWGTDGCYVGPNTIHNMTECLCYHLTTFGTDFYVPPNTIDFSTVFGKFKDLSENAAVFATVVSILGVYILSVIYFRYRDKKDLVKWGATPLADNLPTDRYFYLVSVQTGVGKTTGTTSKIGFVLSGDQADSGVRKLTDDKRKAFKSGSICNFIMSVEEPLGSLQYLRIWHDNSGKGDSKSWYFNMATVIDLQTKQKSNFVCNQWFAVEKGDGQIDRVIPEACQNDLVSFQHLFTQSVKKKFTDSHLWFSVFARPSKSSFTRVQRLSCCMSLLFTTMIANAMFYRSDENVKTKSGVLEIGPVKFTMSQLYTSVISTLIVLPVNLIIVTLFRKAKIKGASLLKSRKTGHIARQQYWRKVKQIENIELPDNDGFDRVSYFNVDLAQKSQSNFETKNVAKQKFFKKLFRSNRNVEYKRESKEDALNKKQGRNFPHWVIYISWFLVFVSIVVPAFFVILYSLEWGKERSEAWLTSLFMSFFQSLLVVDPLKVFIITAVITWILKKPDDEDDSLIDSGDPLYNAIVNHDEEYLHTTLSSLSQIDIREIAQSRRSKLSTLKPIDPEELERQRIERKNAVKLKEIIREAASYLSFFLVVLFLSYQARSKNSFYVHKDLSNSLLNNKEMAFEDIQSRDDLWNYIEKVFVPSMYAPRWYNDKRISWREKLTTFDRFNLRVGASRIRQLRIKENSCIVNPKMAQLFDHCRDDYNWVDDDTKDYDVSWKPIINGTMTNSSSTRAEAGIKKRKTKWKCQNAWCYQNTLQTKSTPILGKFTTYKGGGYAMSLGRTLERTQKLLTALKSEKWIDELTRAVFMEFSLYNPNVNLFSSGTLIVEYLSTGSATTYQAISVFTLYNHLGSFGIIVLIFEIIYIIYIIYFLIFEILKMKRQKCHYFKQFWNLNECVIISFSIVSMVMYVMKTVFTNVAIKTVFESELGEFVNFNTIGLWDEIFNAVSAIVVFCATLKFMKLLRFNKHIGILAATLKHANKDLLGFSATFGIIFMAFTQFGNLIFGSKNPYYKDFISSLTSTFRFSLGQFDLKELQDANYLLGSVYFVIFILIVIMGLMSMFVTILDQAYHEVKEEIEAQGDDNEIVDYFFEKIKKLNPKKKKIKRQHSSELNASTTSLRVNVKQNDTVDPLYSTSFNSLNFASASNFESHDSMSLY